MYVISGKFICLFVTEAVSLLTNSLAIRQAIGLLAAIANEI
jgi:hypothetical protein